MKVRRWGLAGWWMAAGLAAVVAAPGALVTMSNAQNKANAQTTGTSSRRLGRELSIMEKVIDQMLLDSQNFLVYSSDDNTRGLYLEEYGVLFSFQASLLNRKDKLDFKSFDIDDEDGTITIKPNRDEEEEEEEEEEHNKGKDEDEGDGGASILKKWRENSRNSQARLYALGKGEMTDILLDYGDSMTSLRDNQWLAVAAFLKRSDFFINQKISRLVIKAKMSDLRAFAANQITRETMMKRIVEEEY